MNLRQVGGCLLSATLLLTGGCTGAALKRFAYDLGAQHDCMQQNTHRAFESARDLGCMTAERSAAYEAYEHARRHELGDG